MFCNLILSNKVKDNNEKQIGNRKRSCSPPLKHRKIATRNMVLEVMLGPNNKGEVIIRKGETSDVISHTFAMKYNLNKEIEALLKKLVEEKLEKAKEIM